MGNVRQRVSYRRKSPHISHDKHIVSYLKSGQPTTHVTEKLFSKSQIENDSNIVKAILEQEGENQ